MAGNLHADEEAGREVTREVGVASANLSREINRTQYEYTRSLARLPMQASSPASAPVCLRLEVCSCCYRQFTITEVLLTLCTINSKPSMGFARKRFSLSLLL